MYLRSTTPRPRTKPRPCRRILIALLAVSISLSYITYSASPGPENLPAASTPKAATVRARFCGTSAAEPQWRIFPSFNSLTSADSPLAMPKNPAVAAHVDQGRSIRQWLSLPGHAGGLRRFPADLAPVTVMLAFESNAVLCKQLDAVLEQTVKPAAIWVVALRSDASFNPRFIRKIYRKRLVHIVRAAQVSAVRGLFQMALQVPTRFAMLVDSRVSLGPKAVEVFVGLALSSQQPSAFGLSGALLHPVGASAAADSSGAAAWFFTEPERKVVEADGLMSVWFIEAAWAKLFFLEPLDSALLFSLALRKHAGVGSYVVPASDAVGHVDSERMLPFATSSHWRLRFINSGLMVLKEKPRTRPSCAVLIDGPKQAHVLFPLLKAWLSGAEHSIVVIVTGQCQRVMDEMLLPQVSCDGVIDTAHVYDLYLPLEGVHGAVGLEPLLVALQPMAILSLDHGDARSGWLGDAVKSAASKADVTNIRLPAEQIAMAHWMVDLDPAALKNWHVPTFVVSVITMDRPASLRRLLHSLNSSLYLGDTLNLVINVDQKTDAETLRLSAEFHWAVGRKDLRVRVVSGGLAESVAGSWYPGDVNEYGALFEDDIEASPYWYIWAKYAVLKYMHGARRPPPSLVGISLYSPRLVEVVYPRKRWNSNKDLQSMGLYTPYLYQLPCSWGAVFFPQHWVVFRRYLEMRLANTEKNVKVIPGSRSTGWKSSWKKFMIDELYLRGFFFLYPNYFNQTSFTTNHLEVGEHIGQPDARLDHHPQDFTVPLMKKPEMFYTLPKGVLPPYDDLPMMDIFNSVIDESTAVLAGSEVKLDTIQCGPTQRPVVDNEWRLVCQDIDSLD